MKKIAALLCLLILSNGLIATVYRVNNIPGIDADFTTFAAAQTAANNGDTLHIEGSFVSYGAVTLSKPLVILGAGYFINVNDSTQALPYSSSFTSFTINLSASGSYIAGLDITSANTTPLVSINASNITFVRNRVVNTNVSTTGTAGCITTATNLNGLLIAQNYMQQTYTSASHTRNVINLGTNNSGIIISGNILLRGTAASNSLSNAIIMPTSSQAIISNNVIVGRIAAYNSILENNIHVNGIYTSNTANPNILRHNVAYNTHFGNTNGNQGGIVMSTVFVWSGAYSTDSFWQLRSGSPALNAGAGNVDCGAFDGAFPMKLSGLPPIPAIFNAFVPTSATAVGGLEIEVKTKTHN